MRISDWSSDVCSSDLAWMDTLRFAAFFVITMYPMSTPDWLMGFFTYDCVLIAATARSRLLNTVCPYWMTIWFSISFSGNRNNRWIVATVPAQGIAGNVPPTSSKPRNTLVTAATRPGGVPVTQSTVIWFTYAAAF